MLITLLTLLLILSWLVGSRHLFYLDVLLTLLSQSLVSTFLDWFCWLFTFLGSVEFTTLLLLTLGIYLWRKNRKREAVVLVALFFLAVPIELVGKRFLPQPEPPPELTRHIFEVPSLHLSTAFSFPSGHMLRFAYLSGIVLTLFLRLKNRCLLAVTLLLVNCLMAFSLIYLGHHWATDVVGSILLASLMLSLMNKYQKSKWHIKIQNLKKTEREEKELNF
ncbi:MAG: phosphatase PAP2 family protein [Candidatus Edwardsbacteria bacterium]